jgi:hypothetical protein
VTGTFSGAAICISMAQHPATMKTGIPIYDQLLDSSAQRSDSQTEDLLNAWAPRHWVWSIASGLAFIVYLWARVSS